MPFLPSPSHHSLVMGVTNHPITTWVTGFGEILVGLLGEWDHHIERIPHGRVNQGESHVIWSSIWQWKVTLKPRPEAERHLTAVLDEEDAFLGAGILSMWV